ncbi:MAG TPA: nitroreductase family protein [Gemmatimonadaceae bacterium]
MIPPTTGHDHPTSVTPAQPMRAIYERRAVRTYAPAAVSEHAIRALLDAAVHAPTAVHEEPWRFVVVQDRAVLKRISDQAKSLAVVNAARHGNLLKPPGASGDGIRSILADPAFNIFYDANTLVVICARLINDFVVADCWLAAENLMLAATADGLGTCVVGFAVAALNTPATKAVLGIPADMTAVAPIIVGVPRGDAPRVPRKAAVVLRWLRV